MLEFINRKAVYETYEVNLLCPITKPQLESCIQFWALFIKKDRLQLVRAQRTAIGMTTDVENSL